MIGTICMSVSPGWSTHVQIDKAHDWEGAPHNTPICPPLVAASTMLPLPKPPCHIFPMCLQIFVYVCVCMCMYLCVRGRERDSA